MASESGKAWHRKMEAAKRAKAERNGAKETAKKSAAKKTAKKSAKKSAAKRSQSSGLAARVQRVEGRVSRVEGTVKKHTQQIGVLAGVSRIVLGALQEEGIITGRASLPTHASASMH